MQTGSPIFPDSYRYNLALPNQKPWYFDIEKTLRAPVYRYMKKSYYYDFISTGRLRLNTLWSYHDQIALGTQQGDINEGFRAYSTSLDTPNSNSMPTLFYGDSVNQWAMCATKERNERFYTAFSADCCVQINSLDFFIEVAATARYWASIGMLCNVKYIDTETLIDQMHVYEESRGSWGPLFFPTTKAEKYSWQSEIRLLLEPPQRGTMPSYKRDLNFTDRHRLAILENRSHELLKRWELYDDLKPIYVDVPNAIKYTELIEFR